jgi:hypothetical protein
MLVYVELLLFATIILMYLGLFSYIFLFLHITKASLHLTPFRLEGKKGFVTLSHLIALKTMILNKNFTKGIYMFTKNHC